jgi:hypothetical protein
LFLTLLFFDRTGKLIIDMKGYTSDYFSGGVARICSSWIGTHGFGGTTYKKPAIQ